MFSHLCRACMVELDHLDPTETVPLFDKYQDVVLSQICNAMNLSLSEQDNLGGNVCKKCAETIMNFYTFHLMYAKSNRKLRKMLSQSIDSKVGPIQLKHDGDVPHANSIVQTSLGFSDSKHKCKKCLAGFNTRIQLRRHGKEVHKNGRVGGDTFTDTIGSTNSDNGHAQHRWKCSHCAARFRTRDSKNMHQRECRRLNPAGGRNEMTSVKESEFIDYNDFDTSEFHSDSEANNGDDFDDDYRESKYNVDLAGISDPNAVAAAGEKVKCKKCSEYFESLELLHNHDSTQHAEADYKLFPHVSIKQEQLDIDDAPSLKTESYNQEFNITTAIDQQQLSTYRWKCKTCAQAFETRELLRTHRRIHGGTRTLPSTVRTGWTCNICNAILPSRDKVRLHKNMMHPNVKSERRRYNDETKNWGDVGQYDCELCNKAFISKSKIRKHMDVHKNKDRPKRLCTICGLELCSTYNLNNHIRTVHGRERKFCCTLCDRRFSHSHHLKSHMNRHENIRPFQCDQCVKSFFDKTTLREHIKSVHLNLKQYGCKICGRTFNRSGNMRAHMSKTHNLGDSVEVNRSFGMDSSNNDPPVEVSEDFTHRLFPTNLGEPFRLMIMKTSN